MESESPDIFRALLGFAAVAFLIGAATLDLFFLFRFSHRDSRHSFPGVPAIMSRKLTVPVVLLTLFTALLFTVPGQLGGTPSENTLELSGMVLGAIIYVLAAGLLMLFSVMHGKTRILHFFHSPQMPLHTAVLKGIVYGIAVIPPTMLITIFTNELISRAGYVSKSQPVIEWLTSPDTSIAARIAIFVSAVVVAPLAEEIIFRGILFPAVLKNKSWFFAAMVTGCVFSLIHFHPPSFLSIFVLSLFFCAGYSSTGSLITPIVMHMIFNGAATFFTLLV